MPTPPAILSEAKTLQERAEAISFYDIDTNRTAKFPGDFKAYKHPDVKRTLLDAFAGKCAYCESSFKSTQPLAVEHYRPKGEVTIDGRRTRPGYYWLASTWDNLLPSCTDCNSPRGQDFPTGRPQTAGKANAFPVVSEKRRAQRPNEEEREGRLLLHPYLDDPDDYLDYVWNTESLQDGEVRPRAGISGRSKKVAVTSIEVYALQRVGLIEERRHVLRMLLAHLQSITDTYNDLARLPGDGDLLARYKRQARDLANFTEEGAPYSAMCVQVVDQYRRRLFGN